ncbi:rRNA maturation RNase YbeY [Mycoplasmopsis cricetuli]|uniref:rRNA maturation RNase YbeY n=1 Tax=Mycoplasmopsis cricetuli TaxID=171283 RepID=UPI000470F89E|nr:rRNA maturation RNase YbeY [Mycoplasmopsis cricetuli]
MVKIVNKITIENKTKHQIPFENEMHKILNNFAKFFKIKKTILLDIKIVSKKKIRQLNSIYRGKDYVTDILSFGLNDQALYKQMPFLLIGELVICYEKMIEQAKEFNHSIKREFCYLFAHGLVHLYGYNHEKEDERIEMNAIVDAIFKPLKITRLEK